MSRQFRYRITAFVLGGLIFGAPLLTNGIASAEQSSPSNEGGRQVTFSGGGVLGLSCHSRPDIESMNVPADSTVRVINETGYSAQLRLGSESKGTVPDDSATEVVFRRGTTSVLLKPNCPLGDDATAVLITATPSAPAQMPDPMPAPSAGDASASTMAAVGTSSPSGSASGSTLPDSASAVARPSRLTPATGQAGALRAPATLPGSTMAQAAATQGMPQGGSASRARTRTSGTPGGPVPAFAGMPPGDRKALIPGVPKLNLGPATQEAQVAAPASPPAEIAAAEPVAAMESIPQGGPIGLLALIAAVCVMGVGAAAIRAIVSQRANRAKVA